MKKSLFSFIVVSLLSANFLIPNAYAVKHIVNVSNYAFTPSNLNVQVGDTIRWVWVNGTHTTTSTTIPSGAAPWDAPITSTNQIFEYRVAVPGTYNYLCTPHPNIQIGSFTATSVQPTLAVSPLNHNVSATSGSVNFSVTSNSNWTASSNAAWCTVTSSGSGNGTIVANYQANSTTSQRVANITVVVSGLSPIVVTVTQAGAAVTLSVTPANQSVGYQQGNTNFSVTSNSNWTATSNQGWCTVTSSGSGNGTIVANYESNTTSAQRVATITVSANGATSSTVTVTQAAFTPTLTVTPSNRNVSSVEGITTFDVMSNAEWTAVSSAEWLTVPTSGTGNATLTALYQSNSNTQQRIGSIVVSTPGIPSVVVTVTQAGASTTLLVDPLNQNVTYHAGTTSFNIIANSNWTVATSDQWVSSTADGSGNGTLVVDYEENLSAEPRVATLSVTSGTVVQQITITQEGTVSVRNTTLKGISVFPNPTKGLITITSDKVYNDSRTISIVDLKGNLVKSERKATSANQVVDLSKVAKGSYILKIEEGDKVHTSRIIISE